MLDLVHPFRKGTNGPSMDRQAVVEVEHLRKIIVDLQYIIENVGGG